MVRDPHTGKYRRTRLFVRTLGHSRKAVRLLLFRSSSRVWAELHESAFRRLGGATRVVVLDNLREGVLTPDVYDPALNPLYRDVLQRTPLNQIRELPILAIAILFDVADSDRGLRSIWTITDCSVTNVPGPLKLTMPRQARPRPWWRNCDKRACQLATSCFSRTARFSQGRKHQRALDAELYFFAVNVFRTALTF
jgi:hypothetical protein